MTPKCIQYMIIIIFTGLNSGAWAAGRLHHDPFARPQLNAMSGQLATGNVDPEFDALWTPKLTALMMAGKSSMVSVNGVIMKIGDEIDGYRLIKVRDGEAVFQKGKKRTVLQMEISGAAQNQERGSE